MKEFEFAHEGFLFHGLVVIFRIYIFKYFYHDIVILLLDCVIFTTTEEYLMFLVALFNAIYSLRTASYVTFIIDFILCFLSLIHGLC